MTSYGAVVVGSAIRVGKPLAEMVSFLQAQQDAQSRVPVAYFIVCGALREDTEEAEAQAHDSMEALVAAAPQVKPVDSACFGGVVDFSKLSFPLRLMNKMMKATEGDYRDWDAICDWAVGLRPVLLGA